MWMVIACSPALDEVMVSFDGPNHSVRRLVKMGEMTRVQRPGSVFSKAPFFSEGLDAQQMRMLCKGGVSLASEAKS